MLLLEVGGLGESRSRFILDESTLFFSNLTVRSFRSSLLALALPGPSKVEDIVFDSWSSFFFFTISSRTIYFSIDFSSVCLKVSSTGLLADSTIGLDMIVTGFSLFEVMSSNSCCPNMTSRTKEILLVLVSMHL